MNIPLDVLLQIFDERLERGIFSKMYSLRFKNVRVLNASDLNLFVLNRETRDILKKKYQKHFDRIRYEIIDYRISRLDHQKQEKDRSFDKIAKCTNKLMRLFRIFYQLKNLYQVDTNRYYKNLPCTTRTDGKTYIEFGRRYRKCENKVLVIRKPEFKDIKLTRIMIEDILNYLCLIVIEVRPDEFSLYKNLIKEISLNKGSLIFDRIILVTNLVYK